MSILKNINIRKLSLILSYLIISSYIILGNCLTFNLVNRMPIKVAEIIALISCVILFIFHKKDVIKISKNNIKLLVWFGIATVPILLLNYTLNQRIYGLLYSIRIIANIYVAIAVTNIFKKYEISGKNVIRYIINNYLIVVFIGVLQLIFVPNAYDFYALFYKIGVYYANPDPHIGRLISTYFDPNYLAACLIIPTILSLNNYANTGKKRYIIYIITFITAIVLTVSRSGVLGICIALFIYTVCTIKINKRKLEINKKTIRSFFIMTTVIFVFIFLMFFTNVRVFQRILGSAQDKSTYARIEDWFKGINIFSSKYNEHQELVQNTIVEDDKQKEDVQSTIVEDDKQEQQVQNITKEKKKSKNSILFGIGYNMLGFTDANSDKASSSAFGNDSSLIVIFITSGIIGFIYFIYLVGVWLIRTYKNRYKYDNNLALISIIITSLIICNFNNLLFYTLWILPIFILFNNVKEDKNYKKENINIGIDGRALNEKRTGIGIYTYEILKQLNSIDSKNNYYIYSNKKIYIDFELKENFKICEYNSKIGTFWLYFLLPRKLLEHNIDVFWGTQHCLPKRDERTNKIKYVLTIHDLAIEKFDNIGSFYNTLIQKLVVKRSCKNADQIIAVSKATQNDIIDLFGINKEKIKVVYSGTNFNKQYKLNEETEKEILEKFDIKDKNYLFFISTIEPRKNIVTLIKAFEILKQKEENKTLRLILAGGLGWKYQDVLDAIEKSKFKEDINLAGYILKEEKECLFKNTKCFVYPSLYEGFGLPILEAMAKEAIVVTSNISAIPEVGGDAALYLNDVHDDGELASLIEKALELNEKDKKVMIEKGHNQVNKFTWEKCANKVADLLTN